MKKILIATKNLGKLEEIKNFLSDLSACHSEFSSESKEMLKSVQHDSIEIVSLSDLGIKNEVLEDGKTYKENSQKKALFFAKLSDLPTIADDGGIEISALGGKPGIQSHRWFGEGASDEEMVEKMIKIANELPQNNRRAFFKVVISFAMPNGKVWSAEGEIEGEISQKPYLKLLKGYPYRSFFYLPKIKKFYHEDELSEEEQKLYNHRYKALKKLIPIIERELIS